MDTEIDIKVSRAGFNTILAALRFWQERGMAHGANRSDLIQGIVCDEDDDTGLDEAGIDELCERINCGHGLTPEARDEPAGAPGLLAEAPRTHYYLLTIWGDVDADQQGPYPTPEARDEAARAFMRDEGDEHDVHFLDVTTTPGGPVDVEIGGYMGGFFMDDEGDNDDDEDDDDSGDDEDPGQRPPLERQAEDERKK